MSVPRVRALVSLPLRFLDRPSSVTVHLGRRSVTVRPNRSGERLGSVRPSTFAGSLGLGLLGLSWLRRAPGAGRRWGIEHPRLSARSVRERRGEADRRPPAG